MAFSHQKTIIIAPLDWGMGHATRIIPIIYWLQKHYNVIIAAPKSLHYLYYDFNASLIDVPGYNFKYYNTPLWLSFLLQIPKLIWVSVQIKIRVAKLEKKYKPSLIISDNRPFFFSRKTHSVYITHQLQIMHPSKFAKKILNMVHHFLIRKFNQCWIPDDENHFFAGELSTASIDTSCLFIGGLSRFALQEPKNDDESPFKNVCVLSGPEPMRSIWKNFMIKNWKNCPNSLIIGASLKTGEFKKNGHVTLSGHLPDDQFVNILHNSDLIVTRSGYTTIMDLYYIEKFAYVIPTRNQYEQEYLARHHNGNQFKMMSLNQISNLKPFLAKPKTEKNKLFCNAQIIYNAVNKLIDGL